MKKEERKDDLLSFEEFGVKEEDVKKVRDRLNAAKLGKKIAPDAKSILVGTFVADDRNSILKISKQPKKLQASIADLMVNKKLTVEKAIEIAEEIERESSGWPKEYDSVFRVTRNELVDILQAITKSKLTIHALFRRLKTKNKRNDKQLDLMLELIMQDLTNAYNRVERRTPAGLCICKGRYDNCDYCLGDGWINVETANYLSKNGHDITTFP